MELLPELLDLKDNPPPEGPPRIRLAPCAPGEAACFSAELPTDNDLLRDSLREPLEAAKDIPPSDSPLGPYSPSDMLSSGKSMLGGRDDCD